MITTIINIVNDDHHNDDDDYGNNICLLLPLSMNTETSSETTKHLETDAMQTFVVC